MASVLLARAQVVANKSASAACTIAECVKAGSSFFKRTASEEGRSVAYSSICRPAHDDNVITLLGKTAALVIRGGSAFGGGASPARRRSGVSGGYALKRVQMNSFKQAQDDVAGLFPPGIVPTRRAPVPDFFRRHCAVVAARCSADTGTPVYNLSCLKASAVLQVENSTPRQM